MNKNILITVIGVFMTPLLFAQTLYFPGKNQSWSENVKAYNMEEVVNFAIENENSVDKDLRIAILKGFSHEPFHQILGPTKKRGGASGLIIKNGEIIASWGEVQRVDMTFSVTKSFLSATYGVAFDESLIDSEDKLKDFVWDGKFDSPHNSKITWGHLLTQSSDWYGDLWGGADWADRPPKTGSIDDWKQRELLEPGTNFEYNDVRVNLLSFSLLQVMRKPLPEVLKESIMDPIDASTTWRWYGYDNSFTLVDGLNIQSVSGGGHSGGGLFISTHDMARFGYLMLNNGVWNGNRVLSENYMKEATTPSKANHNYGYLWWLNPNGDSPHLPDLPNSAFYAAGFGGNFIIVDPENDLLMVMRWFDTAKVNDFIKLVYKTTKNPN